MTTSAKDGVLSAKYGALWSKEEVVADFKRMCGDKKFVAGEEMTGKDGVKSLTATCE